MCSSDLKDTLNEVYSLDAYSFSPNYRWLLKTGVNEGNYSCLLLDVSTGNEMTFIENSSSKFTHFSLEPKWSNNTDFSFVEVNLEYETKPYNSDFKVFLDVKNKKVNSEFKIKSNSLKGSKQEYRIKPGYTSTELLGKTMVDL